MKTNKHKISLPADDAFLDNQLIQWWYWTGQLTTNNGKRYGIELCFFAVDAAALHIFELFAHKIYGEKIPSDLTTVQMLNAAVTDIDADKFYSKVTYIPGRPKNIENGFALHDILNNCSAIGGNGNDTLVITVDDFKFELQAEQIKQPVLHYSGEKHEYQFGGYTYYYSREMMAAVGTLSHKGVKQTVSGDLWFDRQYGELVQASMLVGWQWFAIQLEGNVQIMLFAYHWQSEHMGSITNAAGETIALGASDFHIEILDWWTSPNSGRRYPAKWHINTGDYDLVVTPLVADQELDEDWLLIKYWEGACKVEGNHQGSAYVELVGYPRKHWL
ncbi:lipocalin family protein [Catenovulum sediminis]|uniref:Lipocalin family protein n=1 Tax=Catenovulum sediminis TaxID=1740262 RepID=A0ABV1RLH9_9ALTE|nr:lipocalin family protein [Catenovulum sediminis]